MILLSAFEITLPITNPVVRFLLILVIILFAPILLNRFRIPHLLGLIIAGAVIGPNGFHLMDRDSGIILSGTAGLLYIMFLAGLEINLEDFKKNSRKSFVFGMYTFLIPMALGTVTGLYVLGFTTATSILLASMFASHTLIAYPLVSKLGIAKNRAVNVTVGGTLITDTLALLVLAVIVGQATGTTGTGFWVRLSLSIVVFGLIVMLLFPLLGRWFFKRFDDKVSQYIFVLVMVFLGAVLAEAAGIEAIIGAFLAGLALNRLIPHTSPLMNRIEFVGNAIFIPFFLIGVGMLIDYRAFFADWATLEVAAVMIVVATLAKFLAAWLTQKTYSFSVDERRLIFGLSNAQAAATLAAVLVGYNTVVGQTAAGEPLRLFDETVLNGTILMILVTCTIASFAAQKGAQNIALSGSTGARGPETSGQERLLISLNNPETTEELVNLGVSLQSGRNRDALYALCIVDTNKSEGAAYDQARKLLTQAAQVASATDNLLRELLRYDLNVVNGITGVVREHGISDLILGLHKKKGLADSMLGTLTEGILSRSAVTTLIYNPVRPLATLSRHLVVVPPLAEKEVGFSTWLVKVWNLSRSTGKKVVYYAQAETLQRLRELHAKRDGVFEFREFGPWDDFQQLDGEVQKNDHLVIVMSRRENPSYQSFMDRIPAYMNKHYRTSSYLLIYPMQLRLGDSSAIDFTDPTFSEPVEKLDKLGRTIGRVLKRK